MLQKIKVEIEISGTSSLCRDILDTDLSLLRSSLASYRDETKRRTQSGMFSFQQTSCEEHRSISI
jgi:CHASE1-domain containing sensor protein